MKFDFSTLLLVIVAIIPGLFAQRTRNQLVPRSFAPQGASAELAELVALGAITHGIIIFPSAIILLLFGWLHECDPDYYFSKLDSLIAGQWYSQHKIEVFIIAFGYILFSFFVSHWLGFIYGLLRLKSFFTTWLFDNATWLKKWFGADGLLGERPIIYEVLNPIVDNGIARSVFVEVEMKDGLGFYSGQLIQFAIVTDEEPHKPIFLIDVYFKKQSNDKYEAIDTDGIMIDLADAATLLVKQVDVETPESQSEPIDEAIAPTAWGDDLDDLTINS